MISQLRHIACFAIVLVAVLSAGNASAESRVKLVGGQQLQGEVVAESNAEVLVLKSRVGSIVRTRRIDRDKVVAIDKIEVAVKEIEGSHAKRVQQLLIDPKLAK